ncbi:MAG: nucleoside-diphosphate sugar epimerase/dehydratase [Bacteroidetes bacterium]|nr:nucleoside-diphosphate sugar epimerase/dehydratase [Bacteroidota bacterium]
MFFTRQNTPRWLIFLIDLLIVSFSVLLAYLLRFNFSIPVVELRPLPTVFACILIIRTGSFLIARSYAGIIRYTSTSDAFRVVVTVFSGSMVLALINLVTYFLVNKFFLFPFSIIIIDFLVTCMAMITFRMLVKIAYLELQRPERTLQNVIIYGAGEAGITAKSVLDRDASTRYKLIAFLDDDPGKIGKKLEGIGIVGPDKLNDLLKSHTISQVILAVQQFDTLRKQELVDLCLEHGVKVLTVPPMMEWINGELSFSQIKDIRIEDLLEREEIKLDDRQIRAELMGKTIVITGAAGSIGSELARQIMKFHPLKLLLIDQAETSMHQLELEFREHYADHYPRFILADIRNAIRMDNIFRDAKPDIVYHAAAYKHVPVMENNPSESILTNVNGTRILADLAVKYRIQKFIMVSTDKAVNPTSVMGASKRIAEIYTQSLNQDGEPRFITTRFGNVLGSSGSVIPIFRDQIEKGGPVTVTHPEITRYFMTIPEACALVLEAGSMGKGGEIFIFDMGKSVRITDLAKKMISLSGLTLGKDIQITFTGLRPGEKLYEELLNSKENTIPTHHPRILIAKVREYNAGKVSKQIDDLITAAVSGQDTEVVRAMKNMVPEFISQNSIFEQLDKK